MLEQLKTEFKVASALADAIKELETVPAGVLYAHVSGYLNLEQFNYLIQTLERLGMITVSNHQITWKGF